MGLVPGMRVVAVYHRRFDADLAVALLGSAGIDAVVVGDTNPETGDLSLSARGFSVAVREALAEDAAGVLTADDPVARREIDELDAMYHRRRFADRSTLVRYGTYAVLAAMAGPLVIAALIQAEWLIDGLFP